MHMKDTNGSAKPVPHRISAFTKSESTYAHCVLFLKKICAVCVWWNLFHVKEVCASCVWMSLEKQYVEGLRIKQQIQYKLLANFQWVFIVFCRNKTVPLGMYDINLLGSLSSGLLCSNTPSHSVPPSVSHTRVLYIMGSSGYAA